MPNIELKETIGCTKKYRVEIEPERLDTQMKQTIRDLKKDVQIPGFRKGKAPDAILLRRFGPTIKQEAVRKLVPVVLGELFESEHIEPVNEPDIADLDVGDSGLITFTVSVEGIPEVDISGFEGIKVTKKVPQVTEAIVDNQIEQFRRMFSQREEVDREIRAGDILVANLQKLDSSGVPIIGEKMENHMIVLDGESTPSPEFDEQVIGMRKGETKKVRFTYDESINNPELVGQTEAYEVEILQVMENRVPELDDEFMKKFGDFESIDAFRDNIKQRTSQRFESYSERRLREDIISEFISRQPFEVPRSMVERIIRSEIENMRKREPESQIDDNEYRSRIRPEAVRAVQSYIIIEAIKKQRNIEVTKEESDEQLEKLAAMHSLEPKEYRRRLIKEGRFDEFKNELATEKAYDWMKEMVEITIETVSGEPDQPSNIITP